MRKKAREERTYPEPILGSINIFDQLLVKNVHEYGRIEKKKSFIHKKNSNSGIENGSYRTKSAARVP